MATHCFFFIYPPTSSFVRSIASIVPSATANFAMRFFCHLPISLLFSILLLYHYNYICQYVYNYIYNYFYNEVSLPLSPAIPRKGYLSRYKDNCSLCTEIKTRLKASETSTRFFHLQNVGQLSLLDYARAP